MNIEIVPARSEQAGEVLTLCLAAYVVEAQRYDDPHIQPLTETVQQVRSAIEDDRGDSSVLVAVHGHRVVGSVRGRFVSGATPGADPGADRDMDPDSLPDLDRVLVGRLVVAPDRQRRGIGSALLEAVERWAACHRPPPAAMELFTGADSQGNVALYERHGYQVVARREPTAGRENVPFVVLRKAMRR